jgi:hypothetical protein
MIGSLAPEKFRRAPQILIFRGSSSQSRISKDQRADSPGKWHGVCPSDLVAREIASKGLKWCPRRAWTVPR